MFESTFKRAVWLSLAFFAASLGTATVAEDAADGEMSITLLPIPKIKGVSVR